MTELLINKKVKKNHAASFIAQLFDPAKFPGSEMQRKLRKIPFSSFAPWFSFFCALFFALFSWRSGFSPTYTEKRIPASLFEPLSFLFNFQRWMHFFLLAFSLPLNSVCSSQVLLRSVLPLYVYISVSFSFPVSSFSASHSTPFTSTATHLVSKCFVDAFDKSWAELPIALGANAETNQWMKI